jgi:hypothetical protein
MAQLAVALADSYVAAWDEKRHWARWRPVTALTLGSEGVSADRLGALIRHAATSGLPIWPRHRLFNRRPRAGAYVWKRARRGVLYRARSPEADDPVICQLQGAGQRMR